jgi:hypothetical protein
MSAHLFLNLPGEIVPAIIHGEYDPIDAQSGIETLLHQLDGADDL